MTASVGRPCLFLSRFAGGRDEFNHEKAVTEVRVGVVKDRMRMSLSDTG